MHDIRIIQINKSVHGINLSSSSENLQIMSNITLIIYYVGGGAAQYKYVPTTWLTNSASWYYE